MTKKIVTFSILAILFLGSCKETIKQEASETTPKIETASVSTTDVFGTYEGTSPGANSLIKETLTLNADNTFTKTLVYIDKGDEQFTFNGKYIVDSGKVVLNVEHEKEGGYYKIFEDHLLALDITGQEITTENTAMYKMKKLN